MYYFANVVFYISLFGCIGCGLYGLLHKPNPWATTRSLSEKFVTKALVVSIVLLIAAATVSISTKKSTALDYAQSFLAKTYEVPKIDVTLGDVVCTTSTRYSCETWVANYRIVKGNKTLTGFVRVDPYGAQDLKHQLLE